MTILSSKKRRGINAVIKKYRKELKAKKLKSKELMKLQKALKSINLEKTLKPMELEKELKRMEFQENQRINMIISRKLISGDSSWREPTKSLGSTELMELLALEKASTSMNFKSVDLNSMGLRQLQKALKSAEFKPEPETGFYLKISPDGEVYFDGLVSKAASPLKEDPVMVEPEILCYLKKKGFKVYLNSVTGFNETVLLVYP